MLRARRVKHVTPGSCNNAPRIIIIRTLHDIDLFPQRRCTSDDLPTPARWRFVVRNHSEAVAVFTKDSTPSAVLLPVYSYIVRRWLPTALIGAKLVALPCYIIHV